MKVFKKIILISTILICHNLVYGQIKKKDTIYYLIDTTKIPVKDRMFIYGTEGKFYGYRLTCECFPWQTDPIFIRYRTQKKPVEITKNEFKKINLIDLRNLIHIVVKYGIDKIEHTVFYFIEFDGEKYTRNEAYLTDPKQPAKGY